MTLEVIIFYFLLIDAITANFMAHFGIGKGWYRMNLGVYSRWFPLSKGWTLYYLFLVLWIGTHLYRDGVLF